MFFVHTTPEEFENTQITGHFLFVLEEKIEQLVFKSWKWMFLKIDCFPGAQRENIREITKRNEKKRILFVIQIDNWKSG